jgi:hypothetical protein
VSIRQALEEAPVVRRSFEWISEGCTPHEVVRQLISDVPSPDNTWNVAVPSGITSKPASRDHPKTGQL